MLKRAANRAERDPEPLIGRLGALVERQQRVRVRVGVQRDEAVVGRTAEDAGRGESAEERAAIGVRQSQWLVVEPLRDESGGCLMLLVPA
jgi:hypothetical protein